MKKITRGQGHSNCHAQRMGNLTKMIKNTEPGYGTSVGTLEAWRWCPPSSVSDGGASFLPLGWNHHLLCERRTGAACRWMGYLERQRWYFFQPESNIAYYLSKPKKSDTLLDSLYIAAVIWSESSNIGLVVKKKIYLQTTKPILFDSLNIAAVVWSESSNIGLVV